MPGHCLRSVVTPFLRLLLIAVTVIVHLVTVYGCTHLRFAFGSHVCLTAPFGSRGSRAVAATHLLDGTHAVAFAALVAAVTVCGLPRHVFCDTRTHGSTLRHVAVLHGLVRTTRATFAARRPVLPGSAVIGYV